MADHRNVLDEKIVEKLVAQKTLFIWDKSALCAKGFEPCFRKICKVINKNRNYFIVPIFAKNVGEDLFAGKVLDKKVFPVIGRSDYKELFLLLKQKSFSQVILLVNDSENAKMGYAAGKATGIIPTLYSLQDDGEIVSFQLQKDKKPSPASRNPKPSNPDTHKPYQGPCFTIKSEPERVALRAIRVNDVLSIGSTVKDSKGKEYKICKQESLNNSAVTYSTDVNGIWVKLYDSSALNTYLEAKIDRMLTQTMECPGLCWPMDKVFDTNGVFRGYLLKGFKGIPLHLCIFKRAGIDAYFPNWSKIDLCDLTLTILKKIEFLHKRNVLFGCINPAAIRVVDKNTVYFTDTDNYQVDGFPSFVHNISFTPPELIGKKVYLAGKANESFAVAELVFMLMMPGKTPYAIGGNEAPEQLIKKMEFPYANGPIHGNNALPGMWRFMWSHMGSLKGSFYNSFQAGGKYNALEDRKEAYYWYTAVSFYKKDLQQSKDKESLKIYPKTFKRGGGESFYKCAYCNVEHPRFYFYHQYFDDYKICNGCIDKKSDVSFTCKACEKTYYYTNRTALFHKRMKQKDSNWKDQKYCRDCKKKTLPCITCGVEWPYYYLQNGKCPECRTSRKKGK